jgi:hypothetical protein
MIEGRTGEVIPWVYERGFEKFDQELTRWFHFRKAL